MENTPEPNRIEIDPVSLKHLNSIRKWTMFFAVLGFIFVGLLLIAGIVAGAFLTIFNSGMPDTGVPQWLMSVIFVVIAAVYFIPVFFLFRFSSNMRDAVHSLKQEKIRKAFRNLRAYFTYLGVLVILGLCFYVTALIIAGSSLAFFKHS
jgi:uncharacterized membrane protein